jgi:hypothetical protein
MGLYMTGRLAIVKQIFGGSSFLLSNTDIETPDMWLNIE